MAARLIGAAGATAMPDWVATGPEAEPVAVTDCEPAVRKVTPKACTP